MLLPVQVAIIPLNKVLSRLEDQCGADDLFQNEAPLAPHTIQRLIKRRSAKGASAPFRFRGRNSRDHKHSPQGSASLRLGDLARHGNPWCVEQLEPRMLSVMDFSRNLGLFEVTS